MLSTTTSLASIPTIFGSSVCWRRKRGLTISYQSDTGPERWRRKKITGLPMRLDAVDLPSGRVHEEDVRAGDVGDAP